MPPLLNPVPDHERFPPAPPPPALLPMGEQYRWPAEPADGTVVDRLLAERIVVVSGELDDAAAHRLISRLLLLDVVDQCRDITLHLSGTGGTTVAALAVRDVLGHVRPDVATWAVGIVSGAAQVLLTAGTRGKRHALPQARIQLCRPAIGALGTFGGSGRTYDALRTQLTELAAGDADRPVTEFSAALDAGDWRTAAEAVADGLVDHVGRQDG